MSGSAACMVRRTSVRVSARQSPKDWIRWSIRREAILPVARCALTSSFAFAPAFGEDLDLDFDLDLDLATDLRGLLARDLLLDFGFALLGVIAHPFVLG